METYNSPIGRISWAFVFGEGDPDADTPAKYSITLMLPKNKKAIQHLGLNPAQQKKILVETEAFVAQIRQEGETMAKAQFKKGWEGTRWNPVLDGDEQTWDGNANFWLLRAKTKFKPKVSQPKKSDGLIVDGDEDPLTGFYSGCWARAVLSLYKYANKSNKGIALGLGFVQKAYNDEAFTSGGVEFDDDIEDLEPDQDDFAGSGDDNDDLDDLE